MKNHKQSSVGALFSALTSSNDPEHHDKKDDIHHEPSSEIKILVIYEQPHGTGLHMNLTLDREITTFALKSDLRNVTKVPVEFISLIHLNNILEDDKSLQVQGVEHDDVVVLRDLRLSYSFP